jgi:hypothetical protein
VERHLARLLPHSPIGISARLTWPPPFPVPTRTQMQIIHRPANTMLVDR